MSARVDSSSHMMHPVRLDSAELNERRWDAGELEAVQENRVNWSHPTLRRVLPDWSA